MEGFNPAFLGGCSRDVTNQKFVSFRGMVGINTEHDWDEIGYSLASSNLDIPRFETNRQMPAKIIASREIFIICHILLTLVIM